MKIDPETLQRIPVTRLEIIDESGRAYVRHNIAKVNVSIQDDGKTLKIFVNGTLNERQDKSS